MLKNRYERYFEKWEQRKRAKFSDKVFLERYITRFGRTSMQKRLMPLAAGLFLLMAVCWMITYILSKDIFPDLILFIATFFCSGLWGLNCYLYFSHRFKYHEQKVEKWKEELSTQNQKVLF